MDKSSDMKLSQRERKLLIMFLDDIRAYERESRNLIGFDERESSEFVDIFEAKEEPVCEHDWKVERFDRYGFAMEAYCDKCGKVEER